MRITWVTRSFLDYRIPVYSALNRLCGNNLTVIYNGDIVPVRCRDKLRNVLKDRAIALSGEVRICGEAYDNASMANTGYRIPLQKGLIKLIRSQKPDVIISDGFFQWTYAALIVRAFNLKGIKHIMCYERTPHTERNAGKLRTFYRKFVSRWIDVIDCNGILTAEYVTKYLNYKKLLTFGHMTAETDGILQRVNAISNNEVEKLKRNLNLKGTIFLYLGQLIERKGIKELVEAWEKAALLDSKLVLIGEGEQKKEILEYIHSNKISNIVLTGNVDYDKLAPYLKAADCFIIPTLEDNWSLVVPEAMAAGLPIACSIYNGCYPELVKPENGWTFDPLNQEDFIKTLKTIYQSRDRLKEMGEESQKIVANHSPAHAAKGIYDACVKLLNKN